MNNYISIYFIILSLIIVLLYYIFIPYLKKLKFGQIVRKEGPRNHLNKNGTPTMGGLIMFLIFIITFLSILLINKNNIKLTNDLPVILLILIPIIGYFLIGFIDDFLIVVKRNNTGLKPLYKLIFQLIISLIFYIIYTFYINDTYLHFINYDINLKYLYGPFIMLLFISTSNSTNLTDGIDGLLSISTFPLVIAFIVLGLLKDNTLVVITSICFLLVLLSFLFFNFPKASIFMGDTGSLMIGGYISVMTILLKCELLLILFGIVYVIEALSVIIQVYYYKKTKGKRIFKMTPFHHHLELSGCNDIMINIIFFLISSIGVIIGLFMELII